MTAKRMNRLFELHPGTGVIAIRGNGKSNCYFYQDFDDAVPGLDRAIKDFYPLRIKGAITTLMLFYKPNAFPIIL